jgi:MFS family permease
MLAGLRLVVNDRRLRAIAICTAWSNLFSCIAFTMLIVLLAGDLRIEPFQIGMYYSVAAVGGVIGAVLATRITDLIGQSRAIWMAPALSAPVAMAMAVAQPGWLLWVSALGVSAYWFGAVVYNVAQTSMRQQICPENMLGRMNATIRFFVWGMFPLGAAAGGLIGSYLGTREAIWFGMAMNCLAFLAPFFSPLRKRSPRLAPGGEFAAEGGMVHEGNRGSARSRRA